MTNTAMTHDVHATATRTTMQIRRERLADLDAREMLLDDAFGASDTLPRVMKRMAETGRGVIVYLREGSVGVAHVERRSQAGMDSEDHSTARDRRNEWLEIGLGAQILRDLGIESIDVLASRERHYVGLEGFGIEISKTILFE